MKKITMLSVAILFALVTLVGCGSDNGAESFIAEKQANELAVKAVSASITDEVAAEKFQEVEAAVNEQQKVTYDGISPAVDGVVRLKIGKTVTIPVDVETKENFSAFGVSIGYDDSKGEIVSSALAEVNNGFWGLYAINTDYIPKPSDPAHLVNCWQENTDIGLNKTAIVGGVSLYNYQGKVTLLAVTVKGLTAGKMVLNPKVLLKGFTNSEGQQIGELTLETITIVVEE